MFIHFCSCTQVPGHVTRCINDPKASITKEIKGTLERSPFDPFTLKFVPVLRSKSTSIKKAAIPLYCRIWHSVYQVTRRAICFGARPEECFGERKFVLDRSTVIPMSVTLRLSSLDMILMDVICSAHIPENDRVYQFNTHA